MEPGFENGGLSMRVLLASFCAGLALQSPASATTAQDSGWSVVETLPDETSDIRNVVRVGAAGLKWNGEAILRSELELLVRVLAEDISPRPVLVLSYDRDAAREEVNRIRSVIDRRIVCSPATCIEVDARSG